MATDVMGFTGTRHGMTALQTDVVRRLVSRRCPALVVHGDCVGADAQFHEIAVGLGIRVRIRPCTIESMRAHCHGAQVLPPEPPLVRNRGIVHDCTVLVAAPRTSAQERRSGTWATVRYAATLQCETVVVYPDGSAVFHRNGHDALH